MFNHQLSESFQCRLIIVSLAGPGVPSCFHASYLVIGVGRRLIMESVRNEAV